MTTISVYAPIIFTEGITRQLFVDLALTIAYTLVASLVVALTFVPAMASVTLRKTKDIRHPWFDAAREWYGRVLEWCLRFKPLVLIIAVVLLIGSAPDKLGCEINNAFAASFIEPWSATAITYLNCCNVMIYPPFSKYCTPASDIPPVSVHEYRHVLRIHGILLTDFQNSPSEISSSVHRR